MKVKISMYNKDIAFIKIGGELTVFNDEFELFYKEVISYSKNGIYRFYIDLDEVTYIDSSGIGVIIRLAKPALQKNSKICIKCDQPQVRKMFIVSNIDKIIEFVENEEKMIDFYVRTTDYKKT